MDTKTRILNRIQIEINELKSMITNSQHSTSDNMREHENYGAPAKFSNVFAHEPMYKFGLNILQKLIGEIKDMK